MRRKAKHYKHGAEAVANRSPKMVSRALITDNSSQPRRACAGAGAGVFRGIPNCEESKEQKDTKRGGNMERSGKRQRANKLTLPIQEAR